jgi:hypothetical protein
MLRTMNTKHSLFIFIWVALLVSLAACSAGQPTAAATATRAPAAAGQNNNNGQAAVNLPLEDKLAVGTLLLDGSSADVSTDQAKKLLPLWQQVQTLQADTNTTPDQLQPLYTQIQGVMTHTQMEAINTITYADLQNEMQKLGISLPQAAGANGLGQSQEQRATRAAELQTQIAEGTQLPSFNGTPGAGGRFVQGTPDPNRTPGAGGPGFNGTPNPNRTPGAGFFGGRGGAGFASQLITPLIQLLQKKAG